MFDLDSLFLESSLDDNDASLRVTSEGFTWCDCPVDESKVIDSDPFEFITEAMYQSVVNSNNISLAILADNYTYLRENGIELVNEAEAAAEQKEKKKSMIRKFFEKIKEKILKFFNTVLEKLKNLQSKFLGLFKKTKDKIAAGVLKPAAKVKVTVPDYDLQEVESWANNIFGNVKKAGYHQPDLLKYEPFPKKGQVESSLDKEMKIIANYGKSIKSINGVKDYTIKALDEAQKDELKHIDDAFNNKYMDKKAQEAGHTNTDNFYSKKTGIITNVAKTAVDLIMQRQSAAAKAIKSLNGSSDKVSESASYLDRLQLV